jgi:hypothetical protein
VTEPSEQYVQQREDEQPTPATVERLLRELASVYQTEHDVDRWVAGRKATWGRQLRASTVGELREALKTWQAESNKAPTLNEFLQHVSRARQRARVGARRCDHCEDGLRRIMVRVTDGRGRYHHADESMARCDCEAGNKYAGSTARIATLDDAVGRLRARGLVDGIGYAVESKGQPLYAVRRRWEGRAPLGPTQAPAIDPMDMASYLDEAPRVRERDRVEGYRGDDDGRAVQRITEVERRYP